jgi:hypothetical protein
MSDKIYMGIDPGKSGFITFNIGDEIYFKPIDELVVGKEYSALMIKDFFKQFEGIDIHIVLEGVNCDPNWTPLTNWSLSRCIALIEMAMTCFELPHTLVKPQAWQKEMFQGVPEMRKPSTTVNKKNGQSYVKKGKLDTKPMSILASQRLFPKVNLAHGKTARATVPNDNKSDALLMYAYCKRNF